MFPRYRRHSAAPREYLKVLRPTHRRLLFTAAPVFHFLRFPIVRVLARKQEHSSYWANRQDSGHCVSNGECSLVIAGRKKQ